MVVSFQNVSRFYNDWPALERINLQLAQGEFLVISGPSGAGKTTLFRHIWMGDLPSSGIVEVAGYSSDRIGRRDLPLLRRKLGIVFQDFRLLPERTVFDNVALPLQVAGTSPKAVRRRVFSLLAEMELNHRRGSYPHELSGGEQQRVAIARAMVAHPVILLADEPTGNLDPDVSRKVIELLVEINRSGTAVMLATHDPRQVPAGVARFLYLDRGHLVNPNSWDGYEQL
jgi:cell division transport system ATP-binding protein